MKQQLRQFLRLSLICTLVLPSFFVLADEMKEEKSNLKYITYTCEKNPKKFTYGPIHTVKSETNMSAVYDKQTGANRPSCMSGDPALKPTGGIVFNSKKNTYPCAELSNCPRSATFRYADAVYQIKAACCPLVENQTD